VTPEGKKFLCANLQRIVGKRGQIGKEGVGDTRVKSLKNDSDEQGKGRQFFRRKINRSDTVELATKKRSPGFAAKSRGVTPSVAAPGVIHPSNTTA